jgi:Flp pilus assembly protein TadB
MLAESPAVSGDGTGFGLPPWAYAGPVGRGGGVPWFKLRPRSMDRTLDDRIPPDPHRSPCVTPSTALAVVSCIAGILLLALAALLWGAFPVLAGLALVFGGALLIVSVLTWRDRRRLS